MESSGKKKQFKFYDSYILKVLKTIGPIGITLDCRNQMNSCIMNISKYISTIAFELIISNGKKTLSHEEVSNALRIIFGDTDKEFLEKMLNECQLARASFTNSEKNASRQVKAGIIFAPSVAERFLRNFDYHKMMLSSGAPIYLAVALEFITMNILLEGVEALQTNKHKRLTIKDIDKGIKGHKTLSRLFEKINFTFVEGACVEFIHPNLMMKSTHYTKKSKTNPKTKYKPGALSLKHIKQLQKDGMTLVIPKHTFETHIRSIMNVLFGDDNNIKISKNVFSVIQHYVELYLINILSNVNDISIHCNRVKVLPSDFELVMKLKKIKMDHYKDTFVRLQNEKEESDDEVEEKKIIIFE